MVEKGARIFSAMNKYFGTDGIRAPYGSPTMNDAFARRVGRAVGLYLKRSSQSQPAVLLARDTRPSGRALLEACADGLRQAGATPFDCGITPTPCLAFGVLFQRASFGIMITASHNPFTDNGIKCFSSQGSKLSPREEQALEELIDLDLPETPSSEAMKPLNISESYLSMVRRHFEDLRLDGLRIVLDSANGATTETSSNALKSLGAQVIPLNDGGGPINHECGSEHPEGLSRKVRESGADLGIAHDGDGDRVRFVESTGRVIHGDKILGLIALHAQRKNVLAGSTFVATVHSNGGLAESLEKKGVRLLRAEVGDRNVHRMMLENACSWGGESSGHVIGLDHLPTGDGLQAALFALDAMIQSGTSLWSLAEEIVLRPSISHSFEVAQKKPIGEIPRLCEVLEEEESRLGRSGRILLRYSGTEPKIRLLVEAESENLLSLSFDKLKDAIQKSL